MCTGRHASKGSKSPPSTHLDPCNCSVSASANNRPRSRFPNDAVCCDGHHKDTGQEKVGVRAGKQEQSRLWVLAPSFPQEICSVQRLTGKAWRRMRRCVVVLSSLDARPLLGLPYFQQTMRE